jgi:AraC-like DNA-binding protein
MTGSTAGTTPALRHEDASAATDSSAHPELLPRASSQLLTAGLNQRERSKTLLIASIRRAVADIVFAPGKAVRMKNSDYLSRRLSHDYTYLANLFSEATGGTIEQYIIEIRIEWVKDLILTGEFNLTQISYKCNYSSVAHLSNQFKKVTGRTPSAFKMLHIKQGIMPESVNDATKFCNRVNMLEVRRVSFAT